jgi:hypothetical protein
VGRPLQLAQVPLTQVPDKQVLFGWQQVRPGAPQARQNGKLKPELGIVVQVRPVEQVLLAQQGSNGRVLPAGGTFPHGTQKSGNPLARLRHTRPDAQVLFGWQHGSKGRR